MRVLGIEGTAWAASAAVYDASSEDIDIWTDAYEPDSGGIHPREAAEHMRTAIPAVVERALEHARAGTDTEPPVDAVAFSRGPGLGPCLRIVATAARTLAGTLEVPLVGVNHMVAHLEVGRHTGGLEDPVCLNASGANAHLLAYRAGRYRVIGETMDTGVGNALDKFARHVGWSHPGGPKVERAATEGAFHELPYVVKGMDFSFSGIVSAAADAVDDGVPVSDVCRGLEETVFAMLTEVTERALALTGTDEVVLGGGVGQNERLQSMLATMCDQRGATVHVPPDRFLRDNAGMIAILGARMAAAGDTLDIEDSRVRPDFRPDEVAVGWRSEVPGRASNESIAGAEATVTIDHDAGVVTKRRLPRAYRHPALDERLRSRRTGTEARLTSLARRAGVPTPVLRDVDPWDATLVLEYVGTAELRSRLETKHVTTLGRHLATCHHAGFVHGDPTPRNVRVGEDGRVTLIDFGLGYHSHHVEDQAMDLHVARRGIEGVTDDAWPLIEALRSGYAEIGDSAVLERLEDIGERGRYRD